MIKGAVDDACLNLNPYSVTTGLFCSEDEVTQRLL